MKKKQNTIAQIVAIIALLAIVLSIVGTSILYIVESRNANTSTLTEAELQELINSMSGAEINVNDEEDLNLDVNLENEVQVSQEEQTQEGATIEE